MRVRLFFTTPLVLALLIAMGGTSGAQGTSLRTAQKLPDSVSTAFTYQGRLTDGDQPANGSYDFSFTLYTVETDGDPVAPPILRDDVPVHDGLFTVLLDAGDVFDGRPLWLEVSVRPGAETDRYNTLRPRQWLTPTPYAFHSFQSWQLYGNADTGADSFLGTTDAQPLILKTNNAEALRITSAGNVGVGIEGPVARLEAVVPATGDIAIMGTSTKRAVIGRLGVTPCGGTFAVGGCAGASGEIGVQGISATGIGVHGDSSAGSAVRGDSDTGSGVIGFAKTGVGVHGDTTTNRAVEGFAGTGIGVIGDSSTRGVVGTLGRGPCPGTFAVGGCGGTAGIGVFGDSSTRGVVGTVSGVACGGTFGIGGCGGKKGDGVVGNTDVGPNSITAAAIHGYNWGGGDIFIGEASGSRKARIDGAGKGFFDGGTQTGGADYADSMPTTDDGSTLEPGDVLAIDPRHGNAVTRSRAPNSRLVAGVYSTQPSMLGVGQHSLDDTRVGEVPVALVGIVPTKVSAQNGPIQIGDLLVTSSLPGHAMKARPDMVNGIAIYPTGAILGKALEPLLKGTGVIHVLVTLR